MPSLHQDLRLLDAFDRAAEAPSRATLNDRLQALCLGQGLPTDPPRIHRAVELYLSESAVESPAASPPLVSASHNAEAEWTRDQWEFHRSELATAKAVQDQWSDCGSWIVALVSVALFFAVVVPLCPDVRHLHAWQGFASALGSLALAFSAGAVVLVSCATGLGYVMESLLHRRPAYRAALTRAQAITGEATLTAALETLEPCVPEPARLRRWLDCPAAADLLRTRVHQAAPLLHRDAQMLDRRVAREQKRLDRAAPTWDTWLAQQDDPHGGACPTS